MEYSKKASHIKPSSTLGLTAKANQLKADGVDIVSFTAGEPDFDTPEHIKQAAIDAIHAGFTKYTPVPGTLELRKCIAENYKKQGLYYDFSQIIVSNGGKHALTNIFWAILNEGDEVMIPAPFWLSYPEMVQITGGVPVIVQTEKKNGFKITRQELEAAYTNKTKAVIINSPSNPSGVVYTRNELNDIAAFAVEKDLLVISDEIYDKLVYGDAEFVSIASINDEIFKRTIVCNGFSKTYAMTGWRVGYTASPPEIAKLMSNVQSHTASNANSIAQKAAYAALSGPQQCVMQMQKAFKERRDYICERINAIDGIATMVPDGAFYVFVDVSELLGQSFDGKVLKDATDVSEALLISQNCVVVPCDDFGANDYIRLSYATSMENITKGMDRIERFVKQYYGKKA